jgi:chaperonin GroES
MPETQQEEVREFEALILDQINAETLQRQIADRIDEDTREIGRTVFKGYEIDENSRDDWKTTNEDILDLARQIGGSKEYKGEAVANVRYPIIMTAAMQFSARAFPNIIKGSEVVKCQIVGSDPEGLKAARGKRVKQHMSYQVLEQMESWEEEMDQLLMSMAFVGCMFKKTYYDPVEGVPVSALVMAEDLVVDYGAKSLEKAPRITHILRLYPNTVEERIRSGAYLDHKYDVGTDEDDGDDDEDKPVTYLEQHFWLDLDGDGYKEPYVVTIHKGLKEVVRIVARFDIEGIKKDDKGRIIRIIPIHYFTQFTFLPAPDGGFYKMGFGAMLAPLTHTVNTTINQLLDAGKLANRQGGFLGRGVKLKRDGSKGSSLYFSQGEWKYVQSMGDDLRKGIVPLPTKEPSSVMFQLLGLMLEASKELASQADVLTGEHPKGNVPATTTLALIEQGLKVFSAIYKRIYRALKLEFKKIRRINTLYLDEEEYNNIIDYTKTIEVQDPRSGEMVEVIQQVIADPREDYSDIFMDIIPISGAADVSDTQRIMKAQALVEMRGQGLNDDAINKRYLEALEIPDVAEILPEEGSQPPLDPKIIIEEEKLRLKNLELQLKQFELEFKERESEGKVLKLWGDTLKALAQAEAAEAGPQLELYNNYVLMQNARVKAQADIQKELVKPRPTGGESGDTNRTAGKS